MAGTVIQAFFRGGPPKPVHPAFQSAPIQAKAPRGGQPAGLAVDPVRLGLASGPGQPLPHDVCQLMERAFGASFDAVRIHVGPQAERIGAIAFTTGNAIYFAPGQFRPETPDGRRLLGHELAHVLQQRQGRVRNPTGVGLAVVQDAMLEAEADRLGERVRHMTLAAPTWNAAQPAAGAATAPLVGPPRFAGSAPVQRMAAPRRAPLAAMGRASIIQPMLEGLSDAWHNKRKVGVEITESTAGNNRIFLGAATPAWGALSPLAKTALWTDTVNLPDSHGVNHVWQAADYATMDTYFDQDGSKSRWMRWGEVSMTEDYGEFEWIIDHPAAPQPVSEYRRRLTAVNASRDLMRAAIGGLGYNPAIISLTAAGNAGEVFIISLGAGINAVSSQITVEITKQKTALKAFQEGLTYGLERRQNPDKTAFATADAEIKASVSTAAAAINLPGVSTTLIAAYLVADMCHKMVTGARGADWAGGAAAANFKGWRVFFPKSHPYQVLLMAVEGNPDDQRIATIQQQLLVARTPILTVCKQLLAKKLLRRGPQVFWDPNKVLTVPEDAARTNLYTALNAGGAVDAPTIANRAADLETLLNAYAPNFLTTEYDDTVAALCDNTGVAGNVVRSGGFATHAPNQKAFAFEDRGEVQDTFPNLDATYNRIVSLVDRY